MSEQTVVKGEADRSELVAIMHEINPEIPKEVILRVLAELPGCLAIAAHRAGADEHGRYRFEGKDLFTATLKLKPAGVGHGLAEGVEIPEHYTLKIKASAGLKNEFAALLGKPVTG